MMYHHDKQTLNPSLKTAINEGEIKNISEYREAYLKNGGDAEFLKYFGSVYYLKGKLRVKDKDVIASNPALFKKTVGMLKPKH